MLEKAKLYRKKKVVKSKLHLIQMNEAEAMNINALYIRNLESFIISLFSIISKHVIHFVSS